MLGSARSTSPISTTIADDYCNSDPREQILAAIELNYIDYTGLYEGVVPTRLLHGR